MLFNYLHNYIFYAKINHSVKTDKMSVFFIFMLTTCLENDSMQSVQEISS